MGFAKNDRRMKKGSKIDPVIALYMRDVDRTLLRENLKLTPAQRLEKLVAFSAFAAQLREAGQRARAKPRAKSRRSRR